jgi:hypothetical protein
MRGVFAYGISLFDLSISPRFPQREKILLQDSASSIARVFRGEVYPLVLAAIFR